MRAIISGGTRGLGLAIAAKLASGGARVAILGRSLESVTAACATLPSVADGAHAGVECDVRDAAAVDLAFEEAEAALGGGASCVVNAAGIAASRLLVRSSDAEVHDIVSTNLMGSLYVSRAAARSMMRRKRGGAIVNIGSVVGSDGNAGQAVYSASKSGAIGLTRSLAKELGSRGVRVNLVEPGFIDIGMTEGAWCLSVSPVRCRVHTPCSARGTSGLLMLTSFLHPNTRMRIRASAAEMSAEQREAVRARIPLGRFGSAEDVVS